MNALDFSDLIARMIRQESGGNPNAVSPAGAAGLMQIMPATAASPGFGVAPLAREDVFDPRANRAFGEAYMKAMLGRYGGDQARALVAYNWGPGNADKWDGNRASLPGETRNYLSAILGRTAGPASGAARPAQTGAAQASKRSFLPMIDAPLFTDTGRQARQRSFADLIADVEREQEEAALRAALAVRV